MTHEDAGPSVASAGSQRPIGYAVMGESGQWEATRETLESAEELAAAFSEDDECGFGRCYVVPLYRKPMLTDAERAAVGEAIRRLWGFDIAATLRSLLERLR